MQQEVWDLALDNDEGWIRVKFERIDCVGVVAFGDSTQMKLFFSQHTPSLTMSHNRRRPDASDRFLPPPHFTPVPAPAVFLVVTTS